MILTKNSSVKITCHFSKQRKWAISPEYTIIPIETLFAIIAIKTNTGKLIFETAAPIEMIISGNTGIIKSTAIIFVL